MFHVWEGWIHNLHSVKEIKINRVLRKDPSYVGFLDFPLIKVMLKYCGIFYIVSILANVLEIFIYHAKIFIANYYSSKQQQ